MRHFNNVNIKYVFSAHATYTAGYKGGDGLAGKRAASQGPVRHEIFRASLDPFPTEPCGEQPRLEVWSSRGLDRSASGKAIGHGQTLDRCQLGRKTTANPPQIHRIFRNSFPNARNRPVDLQGGVSHIGVMHHLSTLFG